MNREELTRELEQSYYETIKSIKKYGGFYVARYEAGLADTIEEYTTAQKHTGTSGIYNVDGIPQSRAGQIPWMFIDWNHSKQNAESMYNNDYVNSGLITGTQWDVILNKFIEELSDVATPEKKPILEGKNMFIILAKKAEK